MSEAIYVNEDKYGITRLYIERNEDGVAVTLTDKVSNRDRRGSTVSIHIPAADPDGLREIRRALHKDNMIEIPLDMANDLRQWAEQLALEESWRVGSHGDNTLRAFKGLLNDEAANLAYIRRITGG